MFFYAAVCWGSKVKAADAIQMSKLIRKAGSVLGVELEPLVEVTVRRMLKKFLIILDDPSHLMHASLIGNHSACNKRLIALRCRTGHYRRSLLLVAIVGLLLPILFDGCLKT